MSNYLDDINPQNMLNALRKVVQDVAEMKGATLNVNQLDEITTDMGTILAGEFRSGNGVEPGSGFTGVRMMYPGVEHGSETYNLAGELLDVLQFGLRLSDGAGVFAGGKGVIDASGINLNGLMYALRHYAEDPDGANPRYGRFEMVYPEGSTVPALAITYLDATASEALGTNRGFELGDFSQWTKTTETHGTWQLSSDNPQAGSYDVMFDCVTDITYARQGVLTSDRVAVTAGYKYEFSHYLRDDRLNPGSTPGSTTTAVEVKVKWYNHASAGSVIRTDTITAISDSGIGEDWTQKTTPLTAPAGALSCEIEITITTAINQAAEMVHLDSFSINNVQMSRRLIFAPNLLYEDDDGIGRVLAGRQEISPAHAPTAVLRAGAGIDAGQHSYVVTLVGSTGETPASPASATITHTVANGQSTLTIPLGPQETTARRIYRTIAGGTDYFLLATLADNTTTAYTDVTADAALGAAVPLINTTIDNPLYPTYALHRWYLCKSNRKGAGVTGAWTTSQGASGPFGFLSYGCVSTSAALGDWCEFDVFLAKGTYTMLVDYYRASGAGIMSFYLDDSTTAFATLNLAGSSGAYQLVTTGIEIPTDGLHHVRAVMTGSTSGTYAFYVADAEFVRE